MSIKARKVEIINALCENKITIDDAGNIPPWNSIIWKNVSEKLNRNANDKPITPNYLYVVLKNNRYEMLSLLKQKYGFKEEIIQEVEISSYNDDDDDDEDAKFELETVQPCEKTPRLLREKLAKMRFIVNVPYELYKNVKPVIKTYKTPKEGQREVLRLQDGWSDLFLDCFWEQHQIPCTFVINKHYVSRTERLSFLTFNGQCKDSMCKAKFIGEIDEEPEVGEDATIIFITTDTTDIVHSEEKKRNLCRQKRKIIGKEVLVTGATQWRQQFADRSMEYGDPQGPTMYSKDVLRKAKQDVIDEDLGISRCNIITSLINLKHGVEHKGSIHTISFDKFFLHYWTPIQDHLYKTLRKNTWMTLSVDATGSLVVPLTLTNQKCKSGHILLYQIVMSCEGQTVPVAQQLSEKQDMLSIYYWLANWVASGMKPPHECISDYSRALLGAITRSFCDRLTVKEYLKTCFYFLLNKSSTLPQCFIRVDVAHVVHIASRWKCLKGRRQIKDFYLRCIAKLIQTKDLNDFKEIFKNILIIAMAETDGHDTKSQPTPAENARHYLQNVISGTAIPIKYDEHDEINYKGITSDDQFFSDSNTDLKHDTMEIDIWINNIHDVAVEEASIQGDRLNAYFILDLIKPLINLCNEFPLWSAVMVDAFKSPNLVASSATVEGYFKDLKNSIIDKKTPRMRLDKFLITHLRAIRGAVKISKSDFDLKMKNVMYSNSDSDIYNKEQKVLLSFENEDDKFIKGDVKINEICSNVMREGNKENDCTNDEQGNSDNDNGSMRIKSENDASNFKMSTVSIYSRETTPTYEVSEDLEIENWKNKIENPKKRRSLYMENHPEIKAKSQTKSHCKYKIDVIRNGNCLGPITVNANNNSKPYKLYNTCPFDVIIQTIAIAYVDSNSYAEYLSRSVNPLIQLAIKLVNKGASKDVYQTRAELLAPISKKKMLLCDIIELDAQYNVNHLIETLLENEPSIFEYHTCSNYKCKQNIIPKQFYSLNLQEIIDGSFANFQTAIDGMVPHPLQQYNRKCLRSGCDGTITVSKTLMKHVWFDTIFNVMGESNTIECHLHDIPNEITIQKIRFRLIAVIDFVENKEGGIAHYVTHVKRASGYWETYNDLYTNVIKCEANKTANPHAIFYLQFN